MPPVRISEQYKKTELKNGLRIVTETIPSVRSISLGVWINTGSRYESQSENGISHLIEHMLFKGTTTRNAKEIASSLESIGGSINAFTSREQTCYLARILDDHLETAVDVLSDITCRATISPTNLKKEKMVIVEEIKESLDNPSDLIYDLFAETYWKKHPLGRTILGSIDNVLSISRKSIMEYIKNNYNSGSVVIAAAGSVSHSKLVKLVKRYFDFDSGQPNIPQSGRISHKKNIKLKNTRNNQTHLCLGFPSMGYSSKEKIPAYALSAYLGGGMSSVLFQKIREERGLVYSVYTYLDAYSDSGIFGAYLGTDKTHIKEAYEICLKEFKKIKQKKISSLKLDQIKAQLKGNITLSLESTSNRMNRLGRQELMINKYVSIKQTLKDIDKITATEVRDLANKIFDYSKLSVAVLGPSRKSDLSYEI